MSDNVDDESSTFCENWNHLQVLTPNIKSRYGRLRKPKVNNDFINYDPEIEEEAHIRKQESPNKKPIIESSISPIIINKTKKHNDIMHIKKPNSINGTADSILEDFSDGFKDPINNNQGVRKFFKSPGKDFKAAYIQNTYMNKGILTNYKPKNGTENDDLLNVTEVLKIITTKTTAEPVVATEQSKRPLKTYSNKKKSNENSKVESFGLPDDPLLPFISSFNSTSDEDMGGVSSQEEGVLDGCKTQLTPTSKNDIETCNKTDCEKIESCIANVQETAKDEQLVGDSTDSKDNGGTSEFKVGDLAWARIGKQPYWPCLLIADPASNEIERKHGKLKVSCICHVRFFADNGRRAWVTKNILLHFYGKDDLTRYSSELPKKLRDSCKVTSKHNKRWEAAVIEACSMLSKTVPERQSFFDQYLVKKPKPRTSASKETEEAPKNEQEEPEVRKPVATSRKRKNRSSASSEAEKSTIEDAGAKKLKTGSEEDILNLGGPAEDEDDNLLTLEQQESLYKRNNLFRGVPKSKVCHICFENREPVLKCGGRCNGFYHAGCVSSTFEAAIRADNLVQIVDVKAAKFAKTFACAVTKQDLQAPDLSLAQKIDAKMKEIMCKSDKSQQPYADSTTDCSSSEETLPAGHVSKEVGDFKCYFCFSDKQPPCSICSEQSQSAQKCSQFKCGKFYHQHCLKPWSQTTQWSLKAIAKSKSKGSDEYLDLFVCPSHVCNTCVIDEPYMKHTNRSSKLVRCLKCPAAYHPTNHCIPASTQLLSANQVICPRHLHAAPAKKPATINANWCFICSKGGKLVCCETCPTSVHVECIKRTVRDEESFICEDCECGRFPLYDEVVWVKLGHYRWWPAVIIFPNEVPERVLNHAHEPGDFVVKFYGTNNYNWVGRGRVFLFEEGDYAESATSSKRKMDEDYRRAVEEATVGYKVKKEFKNTKLDVIKGGLKPPPFIRIKSNKPYGHVRLLDGDLSNTTACECKADEDDPCGPESDCLNRGWGLKCLVPLTKGQFVIEYVGEMIDEQEYQRRIKKMTEQNNDNYYFLTIDINKILDAGPKGNLARFMNHSCQPNCETQKWTVNGDNRVGLFAIQDIPANEELTFNYNLVCVGKEKKVCMCNAPNCKGYIGVQQSDPQKKVKKIRKKKESTVPCVPTVDNESCFVCGNVGNVVACQNKICSKFYHLMCVNLETWPEGRWICPWHSCNICTKRTIRSCIKCINSYCPSHAEDNIKYKKTLGFVCSEHEQQKAAENGEKKTDVVLNNVITQEEVVTSTTDDKDLVNAASDKKKHKNGKRNGLNVDDAADKVAFQNQKKRRKQRTLRTRHQRIAN